MPMSARHFPDPRLVAPEQVPTLSWGIIGPGGIAKQFAAGVQKHTKQKIAAVASRSPERAAAFASRFGTEQIFGSYEELVNARDVDAVYVATPQHMHCAHALLAIRAGKHVLVEKPLALSSRDAQSIFDAAREESVFAMEAMWTRYLPHMDVIRQLLADGAVGAVRIVTASSNVRTTVLSGIGVIGSRKVLRREAFHDREEHRLHRTDAASYPHST